ncbi:ethanolamine utilization protein EutH [Clostridium sp. YIM B02515]|uniref:Ethanolamine utilization protein EutH n=1 Tax=Clostridium rhizosphaerae TaxID=2803861 RepID=A0ABS1TE02_9CLOT|nr:ethanolamine utilization protein EutH [Clostridium rhizosphaerae]MBL4936203.1 ethanolamine utilization protein EutH [Clostridium rhizosphaerae]
MISKILIYVIGVFFIIGAIDYMFGNPLRLGYKFEEGIKTMGTLALGIIGIYSLSPLLLKLFSPVSQFVWRTFSLDPSIIPGSVFAVDMGAYELCKNISFNSELGRFMGIIVGSTLGAAFSFTIPIAFSITEDEDKEFIAKGIMIGIITIPAGCIAAGIWLGIDLTLLLWNMTPIVLISLLLGILILKAPGIIIKVFRYFGRLIIGLSVLGLIFQGIYLIYGFKVLSSIISFEDSTALVGKITIILGGAYPMLEVINRMLRVPLNKLGERFGLTSSEITAMIGNLASNLLVFGNLKHMNEKGKVMCTAFAVSGAFIFGGQLAYIASVEAKLIGAFFICKSVSGILSLLLSNFIIEKENQQINIGEVMGYGD